MTDIPNSAPARRGSAPMVGEKSAKASSERPFSAFLSGDSDSHSGSAVADRGGLGSGQNPEETPSSEPTRKAAPKAARDGSKVNAEEAGPIVEEDPPAEVLVATLPVGQASTDPIPDPDAISAIQESKLRVSAAAATREIAADSTAGALRATGPGLTDPATGSGMDPDADLRVVRGLIEANVISSGGAPRPQSMLAVAHQNAAADGDTGARGARAADGSVVSGPANTAAERPPGPSTDSATAARLDSRTTSPVGGTGQDMPWSGDRAEARADRAQREVPADARIDTRMLPPDAQGAARQAKRPGVANESRGKPERLVETPVAVPPGLSGDRPPAPAAPGFAEAERPSDGRANPSTPFPESGLPAGQLMPQPQAKSADTTAGRRTGRAAAVPDAPRTDSAPATAVSAPALMTAMSIAPPASAPVANAVSREAERGFSSVIGEGPSPEMSGITSSADRAGSTPQARAIVSDPALPRQIAVQLMDAMRGNPDRPVELVLEPAELGRVRMSMAGGDGTMQVSLTIERMETADLLRRHIETLAQEFRQLGYRDVSFRFSGEGASSNGGQGFASGTAGDGLIEGAEPDGPSPVRLLLGDRMDIRL